MLQFTISVCYMYMYVMCVRLAQSNDMQQYSRDEEEEFISPEDVGHNVYLLAHQVSHCMGRVYLYMYMCVCYT